MINTEAGEVMSSIVFKSDSARQAVYKSYENILSHWPVPYESCCVDTHFGKTHVLVSGSAKAQPLVLLHGGGGNATMWIYNIAVLAKQFRVYAIDIIGDVGKSAEVRPKYESDGYPNWLEEVFNALKLDRALLCGASFGGWLAQRFALKYPHRIVRLVLLAPASSEKMRVAFLLRALLATVIPITFVINNFYRYLSTQIQNASAWAKKDSVIRWKALRPNTDPLPLISDQDLLQLPEQTLLILGENEVLFDIKKVLKRVLLFAPSMNIVVIPNAGHVPSFDQPDLVNKALLAFFGIPN